MGTSAKTGLRVAAWFRALGFGLFLAGSPVFAAVTDGPAPPAVGDLEARTLIPRHVLFSSPTRSNVRISPDGRMLSWLAPLNGFANIWVAPVGDPARARAVTNITQGNVGTYSWAPESRHVLLLRDREGAENWQLLAVDVVSGETRSLTPMAEASAQILGLSRLRPGTVLVGLNDRDRRYHDLYEIAYTSGERRLVHSNPGFSSWITDRRLQPRYATIHVAGRGVEFRRLTAAGAWEHAFTIPEEDYLTTRVLGFNEGGEALYWADSRGRDMAALVRMDAASERFSLIAEGEKADVATALFDPRTFEPIAYSVNHLRTEWTALGAEVEGDFDFLRHRLQGEISIESLTDDGSRAVVLASSAAQPGSYYLFDRGARTLERLFDNWPQMRGYDLRPMHPVIIRARDGLELVSYLTLPAEADPDKDGVVSRPSPLVLMVHGGPWQRDTYGYRPVHQWLADRGYAVLSVNFRGSTGLGKNFVSAAVGEWARGMHDDLVDAVRWSIAEEIADPDRIGIAGGSYGGYAALVGLTFTPELFACGASLAGAYNLVTAIESFPPTWRPTLESHVGNPADPADREDMLARSPITRVNAIRAPLLIAHGENDPRVKKEEADKIVDAMRARTLPVTYVSYPDEGHGLRPENMRSFTAINEAFFAQCLGGRFEPFGDDLLNSSLQVLQGADYVPGLDEALRRLSR